MPTPMSQQRESIQSLPTEEGLEDQLFAGEIVTVCGPFLTLA